MKRLLAFLLAVPLSASVGRAELVSLDIKSRVPFAEGTAFGAVGPYDAVVAIAKFAVDPADPVNREVVDLQSAPRNEDGKVEFEADVFLLVPRDPAKGNGAILYDVNNRGNKLAVKFFNSAPGNNSVPGNNAPVSVADAGNGFLMRQGYTVVWCGWLGELLHGNGRMMMRPPVAGTRNNPIRGVARFEMCTESPAESMPLSDRAGHGSYAPSARGLQDAVLTYRMRGTDPRVVIPRAQWRIEIIEPKPDPAYVGVPTTLKQIRLHVSGGFRAGYLYELVYEAEGPIVQGLGYVGPRDLLSFLRYDKSNRNPLRDKAGKPVISRVHGFGVSQSGRYLRNFLHLGFNADEQGRKVFDGIIPHVAGGGLGYFHQRFAQPTRFAGQHEQHLYPVDYFPFTYGDSTDPFTGTVDGINRRTETADAKLLPKVMHTQSAAEYWHRSGSLVHTDPMGTVDVSIPDNVRIYALGGTQHSPAADPPARGSSDNLHNPGDYRPHLRALLTALDAWVRDGKVPPASVYPRLDDGTLVPLDQAGFPAIPGVKFPEVVQQPSKLDFGPEFESRGIVSVEPPRITGHYRVRVPRSGPDGNDLGTLLAVEVAVPLATYTGWNLRSRTAGAEGQLANLTGSYIPFPATRKDREAAGDPRESIEERYGSFENYVKRFAAECERQVTARTLLREDADRLVRDRQRLRSAFP